MNDYLAKRALVNHQAGTARTFVVTDDGPHVLAYYSLAASQIIYGDATPRLQKGAPRHPVPVVLLARLAVDRSQQGRGVGAALVKDAVLRVLAAAEAIGIRALLVHAKDESAKVFYERFDFQPLPGNRQHLVLLLKDGRRLLT
ncbi:MAG: GNAT family N-acetyltransferase [Opitutaceae bacterium]